MAIVQHKHNRIGLGFSYITKWENLTIANPEGEAHLHLDPADCSVQILGTLSGATLTFQGSNQDVPTAWETLHDAAGNEIAVTSTGIYLVAENVRHKRPLISGGDGSTDVDVIMFSKIT